MKRESALDNGFNEKKKTSAEEKKKKSIAKRGKEKQVETLRFGIYKEQHKVYMKPNIVRETCIHS